MSTTDTFVTFHWTIQLHIVVQSLSCCEMLIYIAAKIQFSFSDSWVELAQCHGRSANIHYRSFKRWLDDHPSEMF